MVRYNKEERERRKDLKKQGADLEWALRMEGSSIFKDKRMRKIWKFCDECGQKMVGQKQKLYKHYEIYHPQVDQQYIRFLCKQFKDPINNIYENWDEFWQDPYQIELRYKKGHETKRRKPVKIEDEEIENKVFEKNYQEIQKVFVENQIDEENQDKFKDYLDRNYVSRQWHNRKVNQLIKYFESVNFEKKLLKNDVNQVYRVTYLRRFYKQQSDYKKNLDEKERIDHFKREKLYLTQKQKIISLIEDHEMEMTKLKTKMFKKESIIIKQNWEIQDLKCENQINAEIIEKKKDQTEYIHKLQNLMEQSIIKKEWYFDIKKMSIIDLIKDKNELKDQIEQLQKQNKQLEDLNFQLDSGFDNSNQFQEYMRKQQQQLNRIEELEQEISKVNQQNLHLQDLIQEEDLSKIYQEKLNIKLFEKTENEIETMISRLYPFLRVKYNNLNQIIEKKNEKIDSLNQRIDYLECTIEKYRNDYNIPRYSDMYIANGEFNENLSVQSVPRNVELEVDSNSYNLLKQIDEQNDQKQSKVKQNPYSIERELRQKKQRLKMRAQQVIKLRGYNNKRKVLINLYQKRLNSQIKEIQEQKEFMQYLDELLFKTWYYCELNDIQLNKEQIFSIKNTEDKLLTKQYIQWRGYPQIIQRYSQNDAASPADLNSYYNNNTQNSSNQQMQTQHNQFSSNQLKIKQYQNQQSHHIFQQTQGSTTQYQTIQQQDYQQVVHQQYQFQMVQQFQQSIHQIQIPGYTQYQ